MALTGFERKIAPYVMKQTRKRIRQYEEACEEYAREGFRPHYCIHGTNLWTDYDNICGYCEDGLTFYEIVLMETRARAFRAETTLEFGMKAVEAMKIARLPQELIDAVVNSAVATAERETGQNND